MNDAISIILKLWPFLLIGLSAATFMWLSRRIGKSDESNNGTNSNDEIDHSRRGSRYDDHDPGHGTFSGGHD
ncbi:MAG: hypothetical protein ACE5EU_01485 [Paracoccaceae bacterium]